MKFCFNYRKKEFCIDVNKCEGAKQGIGLMFKSRNTHALLFGFKEPFQRAIHSYFVFFAFVAIWLGEKNNVVEIKLVRPFTFMCRPEKTFVKLVEIPLNHKYNKEVQLLVGNQKGLKTHPS